ncbi:Hypothetical protein R9X50_00369800 [Acrodontium crateriforme]|uniref:Epoxide hydrolase N-terminal domain-containing protein n=1 Tax=Acrodontium crateriforme TaxID=150365 RepID=A0AAQ3M301_9PEZI|nr:Hypothetical protein R9X50_00369800 [Acrodontium crateriforme]
MSFADVPSRATLKPKPFKAHVSDEELNDFKQLLKLSKIGPKTYENQVADVKDYRGFGLTRDWLVKAKQEWETSYDWRKTEDRINKQPNFTVRFDDDGFTYDLHFMALFSEKADAVPLLVSHGWPGSFLEFLSVFEVLSEKYTPDTLPFHVVAPSLPGYGYSNGPSIDKDFTVEGIARVSNTLMCGLGFEDGYVAQGGDVGSFSCRVMGVNHKECKAVHLNMCFGMDKSKEFPPDTLSPEELKGLGRAQNFGELGNAYAREHGTRPATIGLVLSASPISLLAWIGEKFLQWSDQDPPTAEILDSVTLYWFTESFPRSIYPYRQFIGAAPTVFHPEPQWHLKVPLGVSWNPAELAPMPKSWIASTCDDLAWFRMHQDGGHFAAMEQPRKFVEDMEDFVKEVWPKAK